MTADDGEDESDASDFTDAPEGEFLGQGIVSASFAGTAVFLVTTTMATVSDVTVVRVASVSVDLILFAAGAGVFLWAFVVAVSRSREVEIGIGGLYFLAGAAAPRTVRRRMMGALALQLIAAIISSSLHPFTNLAFGILVPTYGLGLAGLWGARHGTFGPRVILDGRR